MNYREQPENNQQWLMLIARLFLGGVFLYACLDKISRPAEFAQAVYNYQLLPAHMVNLTAIILPWLELLLGICLLSGVWMPGAVVWSNILLWCFFVALLFNYFRGLDVHCGCFYNEAASTSTSSTALYLLREIFFLTVSGYLFWRAFWQPAKVPASYK